MKKQLDIFILPPELVELSNKEADAWLAEHADVAMPKLTNAVNALGRLAFTLNFRREEANTKYGAEKVDTLLQEIDTLLTGCKERIESIKVLQQERSKRAG